MTREEILAAVQERICGREQDYGSPENNYDTIAKMWTAYLNSKYGGNLVIEPADVAIMMVLLKAARIASGHNKDDNWIDIAGYAACGGEIESSGN